MNNHNKEKTMNLNDDHFVSSEDDTYRSPLGRIVCPDGFSVSVQVSATAYCLPRDNRGPWTNAEIGYPSERVDRWMAYAEDRDNPTDTVYGYVPVELIEQELRFRGWGNE